MANIITVIGEKLKPYRTIVFSVLIFFIFVALAYYSYTNYYLPQQEKNKMSDVANVDARKRIVNIFFFYVDWCPHCKTAKPEWNNFKIQHNNSEMNGYTIKCYDINCTEDNGTIDIVDMPADAKKDIKTTPTKMADLIRKYNIDAYPTIKMTKDDYVIDYDAKITEQSLEKFIIATL
jgi:thiol-disulfide isomerase/thioredoxin